MKNLTERQKEVFDKIKNIYNSRALGSFEILKNQLGFKSKNSIKQYFEIFKKEDLIIQNENKFYINPNQFGAILASTCVRAGFAQIMDDKIERRISMDEILEINSPSTFVFKVSGNSMCEIGIYDEDYVIIKRTQNARLNDVVLAIVDNEYTLKTYKKDKLGYYLKPENKDFPIIRPKNSLSIFGVALGITRRF